jgi:hypothetical protein
MVFVPKNAVSRSGDGGDNCRVMVKLQELGEQKCRKSKSLLTVFKKLGLML